MFSFLPLIPRPCPFLFLSLLRYLQDLQLRQPRESIGGDVSDLVMVQKEILERWRSDELVVSQASECVVTQVAVGDM